VKLEVQGILGVFALFFLAVAWLLPNKAYPWLAAWNEGFAFIASFAMWLSAVRYHKHGHTANPGISWPLAAFCCLALVVANIQYAGGVLVFYGDAVILLLYLGSFLLAVHAAALMTTSNECKSWLQGFMGTMTLGGIFCGGIALSQWTRTWGFAVFFMEGEMGGRPGANLGQINHLNTLCFLSLCAAFYLLQKRKLRPVSFFLAAVFVTLTMALTQSRTGWLQIAFLVIAVGLRAGERQLKLAALAIFVIYILWYFLVPEAGQLLLLTAETNFRHIPTDDARLVMWRALWEAISLKPWFGYGWLQTGWAQQSVAEAFPILRTYMSYSHNIGIDLLIWNGFPIAAVLAIFLALWLLKNLWNNLRNDNLFLMCSIIGLFVHAALEYPLSYAYFLIPLGFLMGAVDGLNPQFKAIRLRPKIQYCMVAILFALFSEIAWEYGAAVNIDTLVRMRSSRIGPSWQENAENPDFLLLTQLKAMYEVRLLDVEEKAADEDILRMERVVRRYPYSPALFQYAWALARDGKAHEAQHELRVLCGIYSEAHCEQIKNRWIALKKQHPTAAVDIDFPDMSPKQ